MTRLKWITRLTAFAVLALASAGGPGGRARAAEVDIEENIRTIDGVQIFKAEGNGNEFYYLPTDIRFALDDKNEPAFFLLKYNQPTDQSYVVSDVDGTKKMARQGGILAIEVTYTLPEEKRAEIEKKLRALTKNEKASLALLPIDEASISLEYIDPATKEVKVKLPPETAPLSGNSFPFLIALSKDATDIMWDAFSKPASTAILNAKMAFKYTGYMAPLKVTVRGKWENVFEHESWNLNARGGFFFFSAKVDISKVFEKMQQDGTLEVKWKGGASPDAQKLVDRLTDSLIPAIFNVDFGPPPEAAKAEKAGGFFFGASFAYKKVEKRRQGNFFFDYERKEKVARADARGSRFADIDRLTKQGSLERHFRVVTPGDWGLVAPRVYVNADLQKYAKVAVSVRYGTDNPAPAIFSSETAGKNIVPREWAPDKNLPKDKQYEYEYAIEAAIKDGVLPDNLLPAKTFKTPWMKSDKPFLMLSPKDWGGPQQVRLEVGPVIGFTDRNVKLATVKVMWNGEGKTASKTFYYGVGAEVKDGDKVIGRPGGEGQGVWDPFLVFKPGTAPEYTVEVSYTDMMGTKFGPYKLKQGDAGADPDRLVIILDNLK
ncbi:MAG TPA: hypothetical protein VH092_31125 [Urbifossiella sp.]|jgi:hypothetical protein|nr:hypothetical protein [Urbifossiella sp.]